MFNSNVYKCVARIQINECFPVIDNNQYKFERRKKSRGSSKNKEKEGIQNIGIVYPLSSVEYSAYFAVCLQSAALFYFTFLVISKICVGHNTGNVVRDCENLARSLRRSGLLPF